MSGVTKNARDYIQLATRLWTALLSYDDYYFEQALLCHNGAEGGAEWGALKQNPTYSYRQHSIPSGGPQFLVSGFESAKDEVRINRSIATLHFASYKLKLTLKLPLLCKPSGQEAIGSGARVETARPLQTYLLLPLQTSHYYYL